MRLLSIIVFTVVLISNTFGQTTPTTQVKTIADLVALRIPTINNRLSALVTGRVTENDGGGGLFFYEAASAVSTNLGTVFKPAASDGRWIRQQLGESLNVAWFGAIGDWNGAAGTDNTAAVQAAVDTAASLKINTIEFNSQFYYFGSSVTITNAGFTLRGPGGNSFSTNTSTNRAWYITGAAGIDLFNWGNSFADSSATINGLTLRGMSFNGRASTVGSALKCTVNSAVAAPRPLIVRDCSFVGLSKALWMDNGTASWITASGVVVEGNVFFNNGTAIQADSLLLGLRYAGNISEAGGQLTGNIMGPVTIENNNFEGQADAIDISSANGLFKGEITGNYFESNSGKIISVKPSNSQSTLVIKNNYVTASPSGTIEVDSTRVDYPDGDLTPYITIKNSEDAELYGALFYPDLTTDGTVTPSEYLAIASPVTDAIASRSLGITPTGGSTTVVWNITGDTDTPLGVLGYEAVTGLGTTTDIPIATTTDDIVTICTLARNAGTNVTAIGYILYDPTTAAIVSPTAVVSLPPNEWKAITIQVRLEDAEAVNASLKFRWNVTAGTVWFTDAFVYVNQQLNGADKNVFQLATPRSSRPLPTAYGGTASSSWTANGVVYAPSASLLANGSDLLWASGCLGIGSTPSADRRLSIISSGAKTVTNYGTVTLNLATSSTGSIDNVSQFLFNSGVWDGASSRQIGLFIHTIFGGTENWAIYNDSGADVFLGSGTTTSGGDVVTTVAGKGFKVKEGTNARMGTATLVGGTIAVANTSVTANTRVFISRSTTGGTVGHLSTTQVASTSFTVNSSDAGDTSTVNWLLIEPSP
jgi:hypothetical protein